MVHSLSDDIKQTKPFSSLEQEAYLNVLRTAASLVDESDQLLKGFGLTGPQYNVLRILRGAQPAGLCRNEVRDRMLTRMPDMTRLLDRMENAGLVERIRGQSDRREVLTHVTPAGLELVDRATAAMNELHMRQLGHLSAQELKALIELLTAVRQEH